MNLSCLCVCLVQWFEEKEQDYEVLDSQLKKLHQALELMITSRKGDHCNLNCDLLQLLSCCVSVFFSELCTSTGTFVKSVATLGEYSKECEQRTH